MTPLALHSVGNFSDTTSVRVRSPRSFLLAAAKVVSENPHQPRLTGCPPFLDRLDHLKRQRRPAILNPVPVVVVLARPDQLGAGYVNVCACSSSCVHT